MKPLHSSKKVAFVAVGLAAIAVGTVGFSSWVIQTLKATEEQSVIVFVAETKERNIKLEILPDNKDTDVRFDADSDDHEGVIRFADDGGYPNGQDLEFGWTIKASTDQEDILSVLKEVEVQSFEASTKVNNILADGNQYFILPKLTKGAKISLTSGTYYGEGENETNWSVKHVVSAVVDNTLTITCTYKIKWGSYFGGVNPSRCDDTFKVEEKTSKPYNGHTCQQIKEALQKLRTNLNEQSILSAVYAPVSQ